MISLFSIRNRLTLDEDMQRISGLFSNLSLVHKVSNHASCIRATIRGSREPGKSLNQLTSIRFTPIK